MGGIPIYIGAAFSLIFWFSSNSTYNYLFSALTIFFIIGIRDDLIPMKPIYKLLGQLVPIIMVVLFSDIKLHSLYSLADVNFNIWLTLGISAFTLIVITNSFNLIDGIDGLSGTLGFIIIGSFGIWFYFAGVTNYAFICFSFIGGIAAFLMYNWHPSRIFMGDTGALMIGFLIGCLSISFININFNLNPGNEIKFSSSIATAICLLIVPLTDTLRIFILRVSRAKSPLHADNNHIHHALLELGLNHSQSTLILGGVNLLFIGLAIIGKGWNEYQLLFTCILLVLVLLFVLHRLVKAKTQKRTI
ncbi:MraY family glycosyltransferase [Fulvivirga lutea]|uniref:Undecaprenyl/decaprenyl-phosphate alpha-N-acetylglucosaminyl 1-phosphate transferase n=1 Tax=Fulvivirga lutea TaxID=2810512 RepID=A0A975A1N1_9BACT|nr:MraY family glycosyltransferase [Fulvivirga lutea]QSE98395.1 undecaprenyl/decaprenyl-phosphate alpha-N-acetylglucosaminyl 1-phosphate transferase [Fulvivirga lutea]